MRRSNSFVVSLMLVCGLALGGCAAENADDSLEGDEAAVTAATAKARIETFQGADAQHYFHLIAGNGEVVLQSEGYASLDGAKNGMASVLENAKRASSFELLEAHDGEHYFNVKASNGETVGTSEMYASKQNAERGAETVQTIAAQLAPRSAVAAPSGAKFETFVGKDSMSYFHMRAKNGEIVLQSQAYKSMQSAKKGIKSVQQNGVDPAKFEVLAAKGGQFYFRLKAANGEIIGRSETFTSKASAQRSVDTVAALLQRGEAR